MGSAVSQDQNRGCRLAVRLSRHGAPGESAHHPFSRASERIRSPKHRHDATRAWSLVPGRRTGWGLTDSAGRGAGSKVRVHGLVARSVCLLGVLVHLYSFILAPALPVPLRPRGAEIWGPTQCVGLSSRGSLVRAVHTVQQKQTGCRHVGAQSREAGGTEHRAVVSSLLEKWLSVRALAWSPMETASAASPLGVCPAGALAQASLWGGDLAPGLRS